MANADHTPANAKTPTSAKPYSGKSTASDPTNEPGQYPVGDWGTAMFGGQLPTGTGAPGTQGGGTAGLDPTDEIGQTTDDFTGLPSSAITGTGAPGTQGAEVGQSGGTSITYTRPNDGLGMYDTTTVSDDLDGPKDSTQANDSGYATGGPQLPGLKGNEPTPGSGRYQTGSGGHVMRGGRAVRP